MNPQPGVLQADCAARYFLEYRLRTGTDAASFGAALGRVLGTETQREEAETEIVVALGPEGLRVIGLEVDLPGFAEIRGVRHSAPATQRDLWVWIHGSGHDAVFDQVLRAHRALDAVAELELELRGFDYRNSHDLIGIEDGTANPKDEKAIDAAIIPAGRPGAGGSFVLTQQWVHDLAAFGELSVEEQERVVGRTRSESIELEGEAMPADSHVSRTDVKVDGTAMKILRQSSPYGSAAEHGLYFVAFACEQRRFQIQLDRMYGVTDDGLCDRLTDFSQAVTGAYWFAPSMEDLTRVASLR
jgi:putative iron-dependent peroxidase